MTWFVDFPCWRIGRTRFASIPAFATRARVNHRERQRIARPCGQWTSRPSATCPSDDRRCNNASNPIARSIVETRFFSNPVARFPSSDRNHNACGYLRRTNWPRQHREWNDVRRNSGRRKNYNRRTGRHWDEKGLKSKCVKPICRIVIHEPIQIRSPAFSDGVSVQPPSGVGVVEGLGVNDAPPQHQHRYRCCPFPIHRQPPRVCVTSRRWPAPSWQWVAITR